MLTLRIQKIIGGLTECGFVRANVQVYLSESVGAERVCTFFTLHKKNKVYRLTLYEKFSMLNINIDEGDDMTSQDGTDEYKVIHEEDLSDFVVDFMYNIGVLKNVNGKD